MRKICIIVSLFNLLLINISLLRSFDQGINTVDEKNKGNWYEKLNWWRKSKPKYEGLSKLVNNINSSKKRIEDKYKKILSKFDNLIKSLKIDLNTFEKNITIKISELNKILETEYFHDEQDKLNKSNEIKNNLDKLKLDFKTLTLLKNNLDKSVMQNLANQVSQSENYEENALHSFEEIENVLDDKKARALYETIENANENVLAIKNYISGDLESYINESEIKINQLESNIEKTVKNLESKEIYLRNLTPEEIKDKEREDLLKKEQAAKKANQKQVKKCTSEENLPWYYKILNFFKVIINKIFYFIKSFFSKSVKE